MMGTAGVPAARCLYVFSCRYADIIATWHTFIVEKGIITKNEKMDEDLPDGSSICYVISRLQYKG